MRKITILLCFSFSVVFGQSQKPLKEKFALYYKSEPIYTKYFSLNLFKENHIGQFIFGIDSLISDESCIRPEIEGSFKVINIYEIIHPANSDDCFYFIKSQNGIYSGAYGLAIAFLLIRGYLPYGGAILGFEPLQQEFIPAIGFYYSPDNIHGFYFNFTQWGMRTAYWRPHKTYIIFLTDP